MFERSGMHAQQPDWLFAVPSLAEKFYDRSRNLAVKLRSVVERFGACDSDEIFVAQFELNGAGIQLILAEPFRYHLRQLEQHRLELLAIGRVFVESVFVADRF